MLVFFSPAWMVGLDPGRDTSKRRILIISVFFLMHISKFCNFEWGFSHSVTWPDGNGKGPWRFYLLLGELIISADLVLSIM